ncbi:hypothetical protein H0H87_009550 [Tephrocybe sp. NHM501043]|nr:hypothetical protein H0H87_009550 [Tephrocybe sp. NHM501043]
MPSIRSALFFAATAFAALVSAAPIASGPLDLITGDATNAIGGGAAANHNIHNVNLQGVPVAKRQTEVPQLSNIVAGLTGSGLTDSVITPAIVNPTKTRRDDEVQTLPQVLVSVEAKLNDVAGKLHDATAGKSEVDTQILVDVIAEVQAILCGALDAVKLLVGHPIEFILTLDGKVLALVDVCKLLLTVISIVCVILSCVFKVVASASINVVAPLVTGLSAVLCDLLHCIFELVPGLVTALDPFLGPVISILVTLKLDVVVQALHGKF